MTLAARWRGTTLAAGTMVWLTQMAHRTWWRRAPSSAKSCRASVHAWPYRWRLPSCSTTTVLPTAASAVRWSGARATMTALICRHSAPDTFQARCHRTAAYRSHCSSTRLRTRRPARRRNAVRRWCCTCERKTSSLRALLCIFFCFSGRHFGVVTNDQILCSYLFDVRDVFSSLRHFK